MMGRRSGGVAGLLVEDMMGLSIADELRARLEENPPSFNMMVLQIDDLHRIMKELDDVAQLRAVVVALRDALIRVSTGVYPDGYGRYVTFCRVCDRGITSLIATTTAEHNSGCCIAQALAVAAAVLGE